MVLRWNWCGARSSRDGAITPRDAGITGFQAVQLACTDITANETFWTEGLGARVSDWAGDATFLAIDAAHHRVALYPSERNGILGAVWAV